ncbi:MAG: nitroreductase family protein [Lachnospiraceae bacterium]|nr:nitroreductase family protein [Lachnospiraceae bacterium]
MEAKELLKGRRSIRKYKADSVSEDVLKSVVELASFAPSWKNTQISRYIAVTGELKDKVSATLAEHNQSIVNSAPMLIIQTDIEKRSGFERDGSFSTKKEDRWQNYDAGIAAAQFCLAAYEAGLGTVIMGIFDEDEVANVVGIPEGQKIMALIALGYPDEEPQAPKRKTVDDLLTIK